MRYRIYIASDADARLLAKCREALEAAFPTCRFDSDTLHGVAGVRFHTDTYDLEAPLLRECRAFAEGWIAAAELLDST